MAEMYAEALLDVIELLPQERGWTLSLDDISKVIEHDRIRREN